MAHLEKEKKHSLLIFYGLFFIIISFSFTIFFLSIKNKIYIKCLYFILVVISSFESAEYKTHIPNNHRLKLGLLIKLGSTMFNHGYISRIQMHPLVSNANRHPLINWKLLLHP